jgi:hypothetical protein
MMMVSATVQKVSVSRTRNFPPFCLLYLDPARNQTNFGHYYGPVVSSGLLPSMGGP